MSRARATALALVNWKGVFYERYLLDRNVTALEGANGAGKTTVMIAAYVVLLPDLARLRFTNLGETGATSGDKGIWGRLGDLARPSYAAIQIELGDKKRVLIGVHLERKAEPTLHLSPFLISELSDDVRVQDLLLLQTEAHDEIPTLDQMKASVAARGGRLQVFSSAKEYFAKLFELGIGPLRLATDEERNKWNEMLRTSMTGGISRALTSELRSFVFKQDTGLSDTLGRMRSNLNACRQTRIEVGEARVLEHEITGVYDSGLAVFASGFLATREQAREAAASFRDASRAVDTTRAQLLELEVRARELAGRRGSLAERVTDAERVRALAAEEVRQIERARQTGERLAILDQEVQALTDAAQVKSTEQELALAERRVAVEERSRAQAALLATAEGLAHLQKGLDELHKQAHAFRRATQELALLKAKLELASAEPSELSEAEVRVVTELKSIDSELARRDRELASLELRRAEAAEATAALLELEPRAKKQSGSVYERGKAQLQRLNALEPLISRIADLAERQQVATQLGLRQQTLLRRVAELGIDAEPLTASILGEWVREREAFCQQVEASLRKREWEVQVHTARQTQLEVEIGVLSSRQGAWQRAEALALRAGGGQLAVDLVRDVVREKRRLAQQERDELQRRAESVRGERERLVVATNLVETGEGARDPLILELCDRLEGDLLSRRYDELSLEEARRTEAELGPLVDAIVVEDLDAALLQLKREPPAVAELRLVKSGAALPRAVQAEAGTILGYVAVEDAFGLRVTRLTERSRLGHLARERDLLELGREAEAARSTLESVESRLELVERTLRDLAELQESAADWLSGDPGPELIEAQSEVAALQLASSDLRSQVTVLRDELAEVRGQAEAGRAVLVDAHLLDLENQTALGSELGETLTQARDAQAELLRMASARRRLTEVLPSLRVPVPEELELERWRGERKQLEERRDELFSLRAALASLQSNRVALGWADAEHVLSERVELAPELTAVHERAAAEARAAEVRLGSVEQRWELTTRTSQQASAQLEAALAHRERMHREFELAGAPDVSDEALASSVRRERVAAQRVSELGAEAATNAAEVGRLEERVAQARARHLAEQTAERAHAEAAKPAQEAYERLMHDAAERGFLHAVSAEPFQTDYAGWSSASLWAEARAALSLLGDRLESARGGETLAAMLVEEVRGGVTPTVVLSAWQQVRGWLAQRVPARIADAGDPLDALHRLREDLRRLEGRLTRQETDLRGNSEDVARNIDVQTRRAGNQVRRLNQYLRPIQFGSIVGIRIKMGRVERLDQVLTALRDGAAQALLFQSNLPIEEALDEIFKRYGGGRGGGHRLLDYREYIELSVEIQRQKDADWELANPSRLSTGEAIGVGAALMMVILTEWERDANLLRAERTQGTLRFLFLDEANRLSRDNLSTLFELCQNLDLQLLIAAPEVAQVDGNTTYRLVRRLMDDGREEVVASGRRGTLPDADFAAAHQLTSDAVVDPGPAAQLELGSAI